MKVRHLACIIMLLILIPANVSAASIGINQDLATNQTITFEDLGYVKDETLKGILVSREYSVRWPDAWEAKAGNELILEFTHSTALDDKSSLSVDWNGTRLASTLLTQKTADHTSLKVGLPKEVIETGYNQLRIQVYMGIDDEDYCEDIDNLAVWLTIHSSSHFIFSYDQIKPELDLSLYPLPIIDNSDLVENNVTVILPKNPTVSEIQGAVRVIAKLGQLASWRNFTVNTLVNPSEKDIGLLDGDIILIGEYDHIKDYSFLEPPKGSNIMIPGIGTIWIQEAVGDPNAILLVLSGDDPVSVKTSTSALANENVYARLSGKRAFVKPLPDPAPDKITYNKVFTFEKLGYPDRTARGVIEQKVNYTIRLSMEWQVLTEGILDLHFAHSELLDSEKSSLTVLVNDTPVGSFALTKENSDDGYYSIRLPARLFEIGDNTLSIVTNIYLPHEYDDFADCTEEFYSEAWLVIFSDSSITLPGGPSESVISLSNYPVAFTGSDNLADLAFVIPDNPNETIVQSIIQISSGIGAFAEGVQLHPYVIKSSDSIEADEEVPYQVLIGRPTENQAISSLNESLPQPFKNNSDTPTSIEETAGIVPPEGATGFIQATVNSENHPRLIVTGTEDIGVLWAANELGISGNNRSLEGDLVILDGPGKAFAIKTYQEPKEIVIQEEEVVSPTDIQRGTPSWVLLISFGVFGISLIVLLVVSLIESSKRKKMRDHYESIIQ